MTPLLRLALGGVALAVTALLVRRLLKRRAPAMTVLRRTKPRAQNEDVEVPWGVEV